MLHRRSSVHCSSSSSSSTSSATSSRKPSSSLAEDWDADEECAMSNPEGAPSRPLSLTIPPSLSAHGPYALRRPNLKEILANASSAPWTLAAFMAYLSHNHCLETLEFIMDAGRYKKHFLKMMSRAVDGSLPPPRDRDYVHGLWRRLVEAYIQQNGSREVNLPSHVRDPILNVPLAPLPPSPHTLDTAVATIYELMEESVLVPFLNSMHPRSALPLMHSMPYSESDDHLPMSASTSDHFSLHSRWSRSTRPSPPPRTPIDVLGASQHPHIRRQPHSAPVESSPTKSRFSVKSIPSSVSPVPTSPTFAQPSYPPIDTPHSVPSAASGGPLPDDSGSAYSPLHEGLMTPPTSPPDSDLHGKRDSSMWRKLGRLGGLKSKERKKPGREHVFSDVC